MTVLSLQTCIKSETLLASPAKGHLKYLQHPHEKRSHWDKAICNLAAQCNAVRFHIYHRGSLTVVTDDFNLADFEQQQVVPSSDTQISQHLRLCLTLTVIVLMSLPMLSQLFPSIFGNFPTILCSLRYSPQTGLCEVSLAVCAEYLMALQEQR